MRSRLVCLLRIFLFYRKDIVALTCESLNLSYRIKNAPRGCALARRGRLSQSDTRSARECAFGTFFIRAIGMDVYIVIMKVWNHYEK